MGNRGSFKTGINGKALLDRIQNKGFSIRKLANEPEISRSEKTIRNAIKSNEIPVELLYKISRVLNVDMKEFIIADDKNIVYSDPQLENTARDYTYIKFLMTSHGITMHDLQMLDRESRSQLITDLEGGILETIHRYFPKRNRELLEENYMQSVLDALDDNKEEYRIINYVNTRGFMNLGFDDYLPNDEIKLDKE